ncbi:MAG: hypothetical protein HN405_00920 [Planctomycetes bacterium]|jgi:hypothetical protein|nr:hypothetical protein [Planctomycetota bacterium]MBT4027805.1 hypothetical protein [Planctomycetota bacterium]MBT4560406.1 hypothetical protein [Planctomycetota bacterium]MBT5102353.1 hypothetical protein [Planctomycetota bacterium]MBT7011530.1 hypothetical protein [Planctomycetota bacterium]
MFRNILTGIAVLALVANASAQTQTANFKKAATPQHAGVYRVDTGFVSAAPVTRMGPDVIYNNTVFGNYYTTGGAFQSYLDEGAFPDRGVSGTEQMNGFEWYYCSATPDPNQNAGQMTILLYNEGVACDAPINWPNPDCGYLITGLPLGNANGLACWGVTIDLSGGYECTMQTEDAGVMDRQFNWSVLYEDDATGPFITRGGYRTEDFFVWDDTLTGTIVGCYWFGGVPFASFGVKMYGMANDTEAYYSAAPGAADTVMFTSTEMKAGSQGSWTVTNPTGNNYSLVATLSAGSMSVLGGTLLVDYPNLLPPTPLAMGSSGSLTTNLPALPPNLYTQALEHTGNLSAGSVVGFSNGLHHMN